jgi:hypothetical protein
VTGDSTFVEEWAGSSEEREGWTVARRRSARTGVLNWWQAVIDETKELIDDGIDRIRDEEDRLADDVAALREMVAELSAKVDGMAAAGGPSPRSAR